MVAGPGYVAGAEPWLQDQPAQFGVAELGVQCQQPKGLRFLTNGGQIKLTPVVRYNDLDFLAYCTKSNRHRSLRAFPAGNALFGRLDAVVNRVAQQVQQRLSEASQNVGVHRHGFADHR